MTKAEMLVKLHQVVQDDTDLLDNADRTAFLDEAVKAYSKDSPREISDSITGDGTYDYALPTDWVEEFSSLLAIEYPAGEQIPTYMDLSNVTLYDDGDGDARVLRFLFNTPAATESFVVVHTAPHTCSTATNTIPVNDQDAVINLAASYCCNALALKLAQSARGKDPNLSETVYLWRSVNRYRELAERLETSYNKQVGGGPDGGPPAALASARTTTRPSWRGTLAAGYFKDRTVS